MQTHVSLTNISKKISYEFLPSITGVSKLYNNFIFCTFCSTFLSILFVFSRNLALSSTSLPTIFPKFESSVISAKVQKCYLVGREISSEI